jgi:hypothetical protein
MIYALNRPAYFKYSIQAALLIKSEREQYSVFDMHPLN